MKQTSGIVEEIYISVWENWILGPESSPVELCHCRKYSMCLCVILLPETGGNKKSLQNEQYH